MNRDRALRDKPRRRIGVIMFAIALGCATMATALDFVLARAGQGLIDRPGAAAAIGAGAALVAVLSSHVLRFVLGRAKEARHDDDRA